MLGCLGSHRMNGGIGFGGDFCESSFSSSSTTAIMAADNSPPRYSVGAGGRNYIEHTVSKFDTLAGVAIKYGVEVADIKRMNGLVSDLQMFALKTLQIPLPGRHPPSPSLSNGYNSNGPNSSEENHRQPRRHSDLFDSFQSLKLSPSPQRKVTPAMSNLQGFYGLKAEGKSISEGFEMSVNRKGAHFLEDGLSAKASGGLNPPLSHHRKCKSVANALTLENGHLGDSSCRTPEMLLKEDNSSGCAFSASKGKGLALRPKSASRAGSGADGEPGVPNTNTTGFGDYVVVDNFAGVRKSSSASSLQDTDSNGLSSLWPTSKWSLKPDLQAFSSAVIARPIFDGLPKPVTSRKNKAALD